MLMADDTPLSRLLSVIAALSIRTKCKVVPRQRRSQQTVDRIVDQHEHDRLHLLISHRAPRRAQLLVAFLHAAIHDVILRHPPGAGRAAVVDSTKSAAIAITRV
ncbi:MAG: hypothetical protein FGM52_01880 [Mycobacterium sp.]|nr:hypothetical protein [Mycobacterium sp.]